MKCPCFMINGILSMGMILGGLSMLASQVCAESPDLPAGFFRPDALRDLGFRPLFTEEESSLSRWNLSPTHQRHWTVVDGTIHYDGDCEQLKGDERNLWTKDDFRDVQLYVEWRFPGEPVMRAQPIVLWNGDFLRDESGARVTQMRLDAGDSGILFRGTLQCQANIWCQELGSGEVNGYRTNQNMPTRVRQSCIPFAFADHPLGQWNAFLITLQADQLSVSLNGTAVLETRPLPDLPARGPIGLQHHGDPIEFRNIWVKSLD